MFVSHSPQPDDIRVGLKPHSLTVPHAREGGRERERESRTIRGDLVMYPALSSVLYSFSPPSFNPLVHMPSKTSDQEARKTTTGELGMIVASVQGEEYCCDLVAKRFCCFAENPARCHEFVQSRHA